MKKHDDDVATAIIDAPAEPHIDADIAAVNEELEAVDQTIAGAAEIDVRTFTADKVKGLLAARLERVELLRRLLALTERRGREAMPGECEVADAAYHIEHDKGPEIMDGPRRVADEIREGLRKAGVDPLLTDGPAAIPIIQKNEKWKAAWDAAGHFKSNHETGLYSSPPSEAMQRAHREAVTEIEGKLRGALADAGITLKGAI